MISLRDQPEFMQMAPYLEILRRREAGESFNAIGRALGISPSSAKRRYRAEVPYTGPRRPIDEPLMRRLWAEGLSYKTIGAALGISEDSFDGYRRRLGLPPRSTKQPPCNIPEQRWTDAEKAIVIKLGYDVTAAGLAMRLPGRSESAAQALRKRLTRHGLIVRPAKTAGHSRAHRRAAAKVEREARPVRVVAPPKAAEVATVAKPRHPAPAVAKPVQIKQAPRNPPRAIVAPLPPEPTARDMPPGTEMMIRRPWPVIKQMALRIGVFMTEMHDLDRFNRRRAELKMPPVYITWQGGKG